ncbi:uncharacterized protein LOC128957173 [Oppia nitens]|uniref:uncharacterized protein LOC128957173 n=1 Tax=Oppia nitens TaxID=1686743 RepID=UPI0023D9DB3E|nr:uncharacterized protein LOC128957173 [Oppia nitens]
MDPTVADQGYYGIIKLIQYLSGLINHYGDMNCQEYKSRQLAIGKLTLTAWKSYEQYWVIYTNGNNYRRQRLGATKLVTILMAEMYVTFDELVQNFSQQEIQELTYLINQYDYWIRQIYIDLYRHHIA